MSDVKRCGAKKRDGSACQAFPMANGRCRLHGGKSPAGLASPSFQTGKYSKYLPTRLAARYQEAQADTKLLELSQEIALLDARLTELIARLSNNESGKAWLVTSAAFGDLETAMRSGDSRKTVEALVEMRAAIALGRTDTLTWAEVQETIEQRRRLVETERKHLAQMEQLVTVNEMMLLAAALLSSVKAHVTDRNALSAISLDFARLTNVEA